MSRSSNVNSVSDYGADDDSYKLSFTWNRKWNWSSRNPTEIKTMVAVRQSKQRPQNFPSKQTTAIFKVDNIAHRVIKK